MTTEITGALVYADRTKRKLSRENYAKLVGISKAKIMSIEQGRDLRDSEVELLLPFIFGEGGAGLDNRDFSNPAQIVMPVGQEGLQPIQAIPSEILSANQAKPPIYLIDEDDEDDHEFFVGLGEKIATDDLWVTSTDENPEGIEEFENENGEVTSFPPILEGDENSIGGWVAPIADENGEAIMEGDPRLTATPVVIREKYEFQLPGYHLSNSELQTFKRCRRKWWLAYFRELRLKAQEITGPRAIGSRLHQALSAYYAEPPQNAWDVFNASADADRAKVEDPEKLDALNKDIELCRIMLEGYFEWLEETGADDGLEIVGNEEVVEIFFTTYFDPRTGEEVPIILVGKLDLRIKREGDMLRLFEDHKSVQTFAQLQATLHIDEQLLHYQLLEYLQYLQQGTGEYAVGGVFNMLRKVKRTAKATPPFYARVEVRHNMNDLQSYWLRVFGEASVILDLRSQLEAGADPRQVAYPSPRRDCSWDCDFIAVCPMFDDGSAAEEMLDAYYEKHDPHDHYYPETPNDEKTIDA